MAADFGIMADGPHMFSVSGELDIATVPLMNVAIAHAVSQGGPITIDMSFLTFMDSTGVGAILKSANELANGCIVLHGVHDEVERVIELMGVDGARRNLHVIPCLLSSEEQEVEPAIEAPDPSP